MKVLNADIHIHTCLSPCADTTMTPSAIVGRACETGLDLIAVCDHNSAENVEAVGRVGERIGLTVIGGMEITSREEVHVLGLFQDMHSVFAVQNVVYQNLPGDNDPSTFGEQLVVDDENNIVGRNRKLLIGATNLTLREIVQMIQHAGGIAIASHVNRPSFSVLSQLGFIPEDISLDAVEVCSQNVPDLLRGIPVVFSSDAHRPSEIGTRYTRFLVQAGTVPELRLALNGTAGRRVLRDIPRG